MVDQPQKKKTKRTLKQTKETTKKKAPSKQKTVLKKKKVEKPKATEEVDVKKSLKLVNKKQRRAVEDLLFKLPLVDDPIDGTPQEVQKELDAIAKKIQANPASLESQRLFDKIHLYMHGYLLHVVLKQFPFIKGYETVDIYQEALIAMRFKAIPGFKEGKGMSFLNFAKMCIKRHLITILNASQNRLKDQSINRAVSMDSSPLDDEGASNYSNVLPDPSDSADEKTAKDESFEITLRTLMVELSEFEQQVLSEWLLSHSYNEIAEILSEQGDKKWGPKAVDNALLRIRRKAATLMEHCRVEDLPLFMNK